MALLENQLTVRKSRLPNAGKGLFTKKMIPKGSRIVEYKGMITTWKDVNHDDGANGYIFFVSRNHVIDARHTTSELARYANDAKGLQRVKGLTNNSEYEREGKSVYIRATKNIPAGEEIFVGYGKEYWDTVRFNLKLDKALTLKKQQ